MLHEDGVDLNGVTIQSSILDDTQAGNPVGALPTAAADAWYHKKLGVRPRPDDLMSFMKTVSAFAQGHYALALGEFPKVPMPTLSRLCDYTGIDKAALDRKSTRLNSSH